MLATKETALTLSNPIATTNRIIKVKKLTQEIMAVNGKMAEEK